ncbi:hypothetical protein NLJ89_g4539 [Agrocybe chaxingu]|uniref:SAC3/GANP/THP3 conserved domain-containing protein n=1 Tax=Agrocybe chaxingu TaxID=84603 RepID=A0A9W8K3W0_9AGAR|nr:hypothetical protein NLJ89_g4539 [Agrocybe chaxingu]
MDGPLFQRGGRARGTAPYDSGGRARPHSRNKHWSAPDGGSRSHTPNNSDSERWERGGYRGGGRGRGVTRGAPNFHNVSLRLNQPTKPHSLAFVNEPTEFNAQEEDIDEIIDEGDQEAEEEREVEELGEEDEGFQEIHEPELDLPEEREKFYQELVKARELERKKAIAEGKMDDPLVPKRLEDAISIVGTCMDMCPRFERYRRERENNLFEWETIPGTKRIDHSRAVKMYERAAGDKTLPSDLRPPRVLKRTLDYLFHDLLPRGGFSATFNFIRDRSRAVRNDFTMQHITGPLAIECHDRCARFHILALHFERDRTGFSVPLEEQQLMNTLQSLKEFYEDQRGRYESPTELEMRVYHRLIHIRDQKERHDDIPEHILSHPVFKLVTEFRLHVQSHSAPITKTSKLVVASEGMQIFGQLAAVLNEQGSTVMVYLVACILERLFGKDTIDDIEGIRGDLTLPEIIDGVSTSSAEEGNEARAANECDGVVEDGMEDGGEYDEGEYNVGEYAEEGEDMDEFLAEPVPAAPVPLKPSATEWLSSNFISPAPSAAPTAPVAQGAFAGLVSQPNVFGTTNIFGGASNVFGGATFSTATSSAPAPSPFGNASSQPQSVGPSTSSSSPSPFGSSNAMTKEPDSSAFSQPASSNLFAAKSVDVSQSLLTHSTPQPPGPTNIFSAPTSNGAANSTSAAPLPARRSSLNARATPFTPPQPSTSSIFSQHSTFPPINGTTSTTTTSQTPPSLSTFAPIPHISNGPTSFLISGPSTQTPTPFFKPSPPGSTSTTPPLNRPVAPPLLKIDTNTSVDSSSTSSAVPSPRVPPPLAKKVPISLPSTPTTITQPPNPLLGHLRSALEPSRSSPSSSSQEILSPLVIGTPTSTEAKPFHNFTPLSTPQHSRVFGLTSPSKNGKSKAPDRSMYDDLEEVEEMKKKALAFSQKSLVVKECFGRWLKCAVDRAAWHEACRASDDYRQKLQKSQSQASTRHSTPLRTSRNGATLEKRRRISTNGAALVDGDLDMSPHKKRARKRAIAEYQSPRTDEELAKRFKENHEEHELRWAQGSFLQVIRRHIKSLNPSALKLPWDIWLSLNPESDATAIWLEKKFDMPESGAWVSESVFAIPLSSARAPAQKGFPGVVVFECTPLGDVADDLEKKYRVLDDCSRLRELIKTLPSDRHFIPSLLIICWAEEDQASSASDFFDMANRLVSESVFQSCQAFAMTSATKDLDNKLNCVLSSMNLDTEGKLVQSLSSKGVFKLFESSFRTFVTEWMENCAVSGHINWNLYGQVVQASISILNTLSQSVHSLLELGPFQDPLPAFDYTQLDDSESAYDDVNDWLCSLSSRDDARMIAMDIQSHRNIGQEFPLRILLDHLFEIIQIRFERLYPSAIASEQPVLTTKINSTLEAFEEAMKPHQMRLLQVYNFSVRRSPKRRSYSVTTSEQDSPEAKRPRLSASLSSTTNEERSPPSTPYMNGGLRAPSPTNSTVSLAPTETPTVTVAMLRALTRDLKKKYVGS